MRDKKVQLKKQKNIETIDITTEHLKVCQISPLNSL